MIDMQRCAMVECAVAAPRRWVRRFGVFALFLVGVLLASGASAEPVVKRKARADALFEEAARLMQAAQYRQACPKLEQSHQLDSSSGSAFNLARCYEKTQRPVDAWLHFGEAVLLARAEGNLRRVHFARRARMALRAQLSWLVISAPEADHMAGLTIRRDGEVVGALEQDEPIAVEPGSHTIEAQAPGRRGFKTTVVVSSKPATYTVQIPFLERAKQSAERKQPAERKQSSQRRQSSQQRSQSSQRRLESTERRRRLDSQARTGPYASSARSVTQPSRSAVSGAAQGAHAESWWERHVWTVATGTTALAFGVAGAVVGADAMRRDSALYAQCQLSCPQQKLDPLNRQFDASYALLGVAGAAALTSLVVYVATETTPSATDEARASVSLRWSGSGGSLLVRY